MLADFPKVQQLPFIWCNICGLVCFRLYPEWPTNPNTVYRLGYLTISCWLEFVLVLIDYGSNLCTHHKVTNVLCQKHLINMPKEWAQITKEWKNTQRHKLKAEKTLTDKDTNTLITTVTFTRARSYKDKQRGDIETEKHMNKQTKTQRHTLK